MKKALVGAALLGAAAGLVGAQDTGLQFSGDVRSGLRADFLKIDDNIPVESPQPNISIWHDDSGPVRATLTGKYTGEEGNYGLVFNLRGKWNQPRGVYFDVPNAYGWFNILDGMVKFTGGRIDDSAWAQVGTDDYNYSQGNGLRVEVKPIEGLNVGFILRNGGIGEAAKSKGRDGTDDNDYSWAGKDATYIAHQFLKETGFGLSFDNEMFKARAGFTLDSRSDGVRDKTLFGDFDNVLKTTRGVFASRGADPGSPKVVGSSTGTEFTQNEYGQWVDATGIFYDFGTDGELTTIGGGTAAWNYAENDGMSAYIGFELLGAGIGVDGLTAAVAAQFGNIGEFDYLGWVWIDEKIRFALNDQLTVGLDAHQVIFGGKVYGVNTSSTYVPTSPYDASGYESSYGSWGNILAGETSWYDKPAPVYLEFNPNVSFKLNEKMTVGLELPIRHWTDYVDIAIGAKPKISYQFGKNFGFNGYYRFDYYGFNERAFFGSVSATDGVDSNSGQPKAVASSVLKNSIQLSFEWSF